MIKLSYQKTFFLLSVANLKQLPPDTGKEVAIIGRSNAGKSSVLNQLTQNKQLARVSKTPGRTQLINLFGLDENRRLADLPGYGFAKVPVEMKKRWQLLLDNYLSKRKSLQGLILVMDIRHPLKEFDHQLLKWSEECDLPVHVLLNKADKLSKSAITKTFLETEKALRAYKNPVTLQTFSALRGAGVDDLRIFLDSWYS